MLLGKCISLRLDAISSMCVCVFYRWFKVRSISDINGNNSTNSPADAFMSSNRTGWILVLFLVISLSHMLPRIQYEFDGLTSTMKIACLCFAFLHSFARLLAPFNKTRLYFLCPYLLHTLDEMETHKNPFMPTVKDNIFYWNCCFFICMFHSVWICIYFMNLPMSTIFLFGVRL